MWSGGTEHGKQAMAHTNAKIYQVVAFVVVVVVDQCTCDVIWLRKEKDKKRRGKNHRAILGFWLVAEVDFWSGNNQKIIFMIDPATHGYRTLDKRSISF
jgi:hypothetical protein